MTHTYAEKLGTRLRKKGAVTTVFSQNEPDQGADEQTILLAYFHNPPLREQWGVHLVRFHPDPPVEAFFPEVVQDRLALEVVDPEDIVS